MSNLNFICCYFVSFKGIALYILKPSAASIFPGIRFERILQSLHSLILKDKVTYIQLPSIR